GSNSGGNGSTGDRNSFFGAFTGLHNTGQDNVFIGVAAGIENFSGSDNVFVGGSVNITGNQIGTGFHNDSGSNNTLLGSGSDVGSGNLTNATAIRYRAQVAQSNSLVLGSINGVNQATADTNIGIGTTAPRSALEVKRNWDGSFGALTLTGDR